jgi:hypothetical protein
MPFLAYGIAAIGICRLPHTLAQFDTGIGQYEMAISWFPSVQADVSNGGGIANQDLPLSS